jgi:methyl-accepting chemotaxis protein
LKLSYKITLSISLAIVITTSVLTLISNHELKTLTKNAINSYLDRSSQLSSEKIDLWLDNKMGTISSLVNSLEKLETDTKIIAHLAQARMSASLDLTYLGLESGDIYRNTGLNTVVGYDPRKRGWYKTAKKTKELIISKPFIAASTKQLTITVAKSLYKNGEFKGVVGGSINLNHIVEEVSQIKVPGNGFAFLLSPNGTVIAHTNKTLVNKEFDKLNISVPLEQLTERDISKSTITKIDGYDFFINTQIIKGTNWILVVAGEKDILLSPVTKTTVYLILVSIAILIITVILVYFLISYLLSNLNKVSMLLEEIANGKGDLTQRIQVKSADEIGTLSSHFNLFIQQLQKMLLSVKEVTISIDEQSHNMSILAKNLAKKATLQQEGIEMVATAAIEMVSATTEIANNCDNSAQSADQSVELCEEGKINANSSSQSIEKLQVKILQAMEIITELNTMGKNITSIINTINNISDQTNLLALNAAIEAARAGKHGHGFAVVSDEVRVLSQQTRKSTQEIDSMIKGLQSTSEEAVSVMHECHLLATETVEDAQRASRSFGDMTYSIKAISDMSIQIATASEEQMVVTNEISRNTVNISEVSLEFMSNSCQREENSRTLVNLSSTLNKLVKQFTLV